jgi:hypothetical protein
MQAVSDMVARCAAGLCGVHRPDCPAAVTGVRALAFTRAGDEEAGGALVSTRDQLADELDHSEGNIRR